MSLVYSAETNETLTRLRTALPQGVLLEGMRGVGLRTIANSLAGQYTAAVILPTDADGNVDTSTKGVIRLAQIRELQIFTRGKSNEARVFIIDDADKMNTQSQNAFLKLLEEPSSKVHFILTSHQPQRLIQTVLSRLQRVLIPPVPMLDSQRLIKKLGVTDPRITSQILFIAGGRPAEICRLIADETYFTAQSTLAKDAQKLIGGTLDERLIIASNYSTDRVMAMQLLDVARIVLSFSITRSPTQQSLALIDRLATTYDRVAANGNTRLQLVNFVIQ